jgi:RimJ/RimL family protein N-acetyltransferase
MRLLPLDRPELCQLAAEWLARPENHQWLHFGPGSAITPALVKVMSQRDTHLVRIFTSERDEPIGIVGLNSIDRAFRTATWWVVAGEKSYRHRGYSTLASSKLLTLGFRDLGLLAINTWAVDGNPSVRMIERLGFRFVGRQRACHYIDGQAYDRLLFDLLASEHRELERPASRALHPMDYVKPSNGLEVVGKK